MNSSCMRSLPLALAALPWLGPPPKAQNTVPAPSDHEVHPFWGGETRQVVVRTIGASELILTAEDGGRIRRSLDGGATWAFANTPDDFTQTLLDIWMQDDERGFACGRGGIVLETQDAGANWDYYAQDLRDAANLPATLWKVRFVSDSQGYVCGLFCFKRTDDGGANWSDVSVRVSPTGPSIPLAELELYALDVLGGPSDFVGAAGAEHEPPAGSDRGIALHTDANLTASAGGTVWWLVLDDSQTVGAGDMTEPWDVDLVAASPPGTKVGYLTGGPGGNATGRIYRTVNGGASWTLDGLTSATPYGLAAVDPDRAMIAGYSGTYLARTTAGWIEATLPSDATIPPTPSYLTAPMSSVDAFGPEDYVVCGAWGAQRRTTDHGANWDSINPFYTVSGGAIQMLEMEWRLEDVFFDRTYPHIGFIVGQLDNIVRTTDGGSTWTQMRWGGGGSLLAVDFRSSRRGVAVGAQTHAYRTDDGGFTWTLGTGGGGPLPVGVDLRSVAHSGGTEWWAVGNAGATPHVLHSDDDGLTWSPMTAPGGADLQLRAVDFANAAEGFVVGEDTATGVAKAFIADFDGSAVSWTDVSPTHAEALRIDDVAVQGPSLDTQTYIVGNDGLAMEWDGSAFVGVQTVYELDAGGAVTTRLVGADLYRVAIAPSGDHVVIGALYDANEAEALEHGWLIRNDGTGWEKIRAHSGEDIRGICLQNGGTGYLVGQSHGESASTDHGNVADALLLFYEAQ